MTRVSPFANESTAGQIGSHKRASEGACVLLLMTNRKERDLLSAWLGLRYTVVAPDPDETAASEALSEGTFDLVVLDGPALENHWYLIRTVRAERSEVFVPFLLVTSRQSIGHATADVWRLIDEMILKPIEKVELHARVEILLRARRYSLRLQRRYYSLAELAPVGIVMLDGEGVVAYANGWAEGVLGIDRSDLMGHRLDERKIKFFDDAGHELRRDERPAHRILDTNSRIYNERIHLVRPDGSKVSISVNGAPLSTSDSAGGRGAVLTLMDVTEQAQREEALRSARDDAEEMSRLKSAFLANMSHEIRTPLTGILSFSEIIAGEATGEMHEFAELIQVSGERLMETLDSLIHLAQLEGSSWTFSRETFDLETAVSEALSRIRTQAADQGLEVRLEAPDQPVLVKNDPEALNNVLRNLLSNAVKFTCSGDVVVRIEDEHEYVQISVEDTGIGISEEFLPFVFDEFQQESQGASRNFEGSGLGLTVTKQLVGLMGGSIDVESKKGVGSTFRVRLPTEIPRDAGG